LVKPARRVNTEVKNNINGNRCTTPPVLIGPARLMTLRVNSIKRERERERERESFCI